jgi:hypothetical protein
MTLDELIKQLTAIRDEHGGDVVVHHDGDGTAYDVERVEYQPEHIEEYRKVKEQPARVAIF